jgi:diaminopimelate decarboxylase
MKTSRAQRPFRYRQTQLTVGSVRLAQLAERFGTPLYVYSETEVEERFQIFDRSFVSVPHTICYSVKANSNSSLLRLLYRLGSGFDVVSGGELERVLKVSKKAGRRVVFSGVGKTAEEMDLALQAGIMLFNVESEDELELLAARGSRMRKKAPLALRVNPDVSAETHPYISTGLREHKFGIPITLATELYARAARSKGLEVAGISVHIGSQITSVAPFSAALNHVAGLARQLTESGHKIRFIDAGGGLGIAYTPEAYLHYDFAEMARSYAEQVTSAIQGLNVHLLLEPGRALVGPAGALLCRVLYVKRNGSKQFVIVDGAMNDLIRPALYSAYHEILPVRLGRGGTETYDVVGPICETGDFFARDRKLPPLKPGDLIAVLDAGAYGMSLASNYNSRPRAAELLVNGSKVKLIRRRERIRDLLATEK